MFGYATAFPASKETTEGLSKREWLAGTILAALAGGWASCENARDPAEMPETMARDAVKLADALIVELGK